MVQFSAGVSFEEVKGTCGNYPIKLVKKEHKETLSKTEDLESPFHNKYQKTGSEDGFYCNKVFEKKTFQRSPRLYTLCTA